MELKFAFPAKSTKLEFYSSTDNPLRELKELGAVQRAIVFLDRGLGKVGRQKLVASGMPAKQIYFFRRGERAKEWDAVGQALEFLVKNAQERSSPIVVVGGGAACDAGALVASLYRRGVPLLLMPTTLLCMIDAAVGGKTAVDFRRNERLYKNVAGTFYPADRVLFWPTWLDSLPARERLSGVGELLKMLWLEGAPVDLPLLRDWVRGECESAALWPQIQLAVQLKAKIVASDPLDTKGVRAALNYGHTLGHAFESLGDGKITHGEAIAWGMWAESAFLDNASPFPRELRAHLKELGVAEPRFLRGVRPGQIAPYLHRDKKMKGGKIEMCVLRGFGQPENALVSPHELATFTATVVNSL